MHVVHVTVVVKTKEVNRNGRNAPQVHTFGNERNQQILYVWDRYTDSPAVEEKEIC